jgi:ParB family transcriptional regulator, chromosome partitioning protein
MSKKKLLLNQIKASVNEPKLVIDENDSASTLSRAQIDGSRRLRNAKIIDINKIIPDSEQPRKTFNKDALNELGDSIREHGVLQPISVEFFESDDGSFYKLISGERRLQASKLVGLKEMPCIVHDHVTKEDRYARQLIENIQREDLSPIEKAIALLEYKEKLGDSAVWSDVEKLVGLSTRRRQQYLSLLNLPEKIQHEIVATGRKKAVNQLTEKHARALLLLNSLPEKQWDLFEEIKGSKETISGDDAINKAKEYKGKKERHRFSITYKTETELLSLLEEKIKQLKDILNKG